ncbi:MAG: hypothetical protein ACTHLW_11400 [Verrucomicrobiota bacterium]
MKNYDATQPNGTPLHCIMCEREIPDGKWFARIKLGNMRVGICRPWCTELFLKQRELCALKVGIAPAVREPGTGSLNY